MAGKANLDAAKAAKNDEFYTQWSDIENEMNAYLDYNQDAFRGKTVLLPCDDPEWSNFTKYFALNFESMGIKKLISTSYAPQGNGRILVMDKGSKSDGSIGWEYLDGDGDFRSDEVTALRDEADMVITNPPFSLFREFMAWLTEGEVEFSVIGNINATAYKEIFPLVKDNKLWYGPTISSGDREFRVPDSHPLTAASNRIDDNGVKYVRVNGVRWFTNIENGRRHEPLLLMTMDANRLHNKRIASSDLAYRQYDNYDAIEIPFTNAIPSDYVGVMGVPISFLDKYNPDQFEVIGYCGDDHLVTREYGKKHRVVDGEVKKSNTGTLGCTIRFENFGPGIYFDVGYPVKNMYKRIFVRHRNPEGQEG